MNGATLYQKVTATHWMLKRHQEIHGKNQAGIDFHCLYDVDLFFPADRADNR